MIHLSVLLGELKSGLEDVVDEVIKQLAAVEKVVEQTSSCLFALMIGQLMMLVTHGSTKTGVLVGALDDNGVDLIRQLAAVERMVEQPPCCLLPLIIGKETVLVKQESILTGDEVGLEVLKQLAAVENIVEQPTCCLLFLMMGQDTVLVTQGSTLLDGEVGVCVVEQLVAVEKDVTHPASCLFPLIIWQDTVLVTQESVIARVVVGAVVTPQPEIGKKEVKHPF